MVVNNSSPQSENATTISPEAEEAAYSSPLMCLPGACGIQAESAHPAWRGVAWHYGDPLVEQRYFESGAGLVDRSQRRFIEVTGPEAAAFLNNLLSQKLDDAADGFSAQALDLDVQGHVLHQASVTRKGEAFYLDTTPDRVVSLLEYLRKMIFWSKVEVDYSDLALLSLVGPEREQVAGSVAGDERVVFSRGVERGLARIDLAVRRADLLEVAQALVAAGAHPVGLMGYTAERVKALEPEASIDLDEKSIPHEAPFFIPEAVHLHKGCYRGQETVARVDNLGRSPRVLVLAHLDGSSPELPAAGAAITAGPAGRAIGRLGTVVQDHELGPIALALVKRSALAADGLCSGDTAIAIDRDTIPQEEGERPGRAAINRLRSQS